MTATESRKKERERDRWKDRGNKLSHGDRERERVRLFLRRFSPDTGQPAAGLRVTTVLPCPLSLTSPHSCSVNVEAGPSSKVSAERGRTGRPLPALVGNLQVSSGFVVVDKDMETPSRQQSRVGRKVHLATVRLPYLSRLPWQVTLHCIYIRRCIRERRCGQATLCPSLGLGTFHSRCMSVGVSALQNFQQRSGINCCLISFL